MLRRTTVILGTTAVLALGLLPQAGADEPALSSYGAGAQATAMQISVSDQLQAAFSVTGAAVAGEPTSAAANGAAFLVTGASEDLTEAKTPGSPATAQDCALADPDVPAEVDPADANLACVDMVTTADPSGSSKSAEINLDIKSPAGINQVTDALAPILEQVLGGLEGPLSDLPLEVVPTLDELIAIVLGNLEGGDTLASITIAPTSSEATKVKGHGEAKGVVVSLLPDLTLGAGEGAFKGPLASITLGDAFTDARYDAATGQIITDGKAAIIGVNLAGLQALVDDLILQVQGLIEDLPGLGDPLGDILGQLGDGLDTLLEAFQTQIVSNVNVTVDQLACDESNPLAPVLCFTAGGVKQLDAAQAKALGYDFGPTTKGIQSTVLDLAIGSAAGDAPALGLRVGGTSAAAAATPAVITPVTPQAPAPETPTSLPRTGTEGALPVALGLMAAAALGVTLVRRTRAA